MRNAVFTAAFFATAAGFWMAWPPLGLIVPGMILMCLLIVSQLMGEAQSAQSADPDS